MNHLRDTTAYTPQAIIDGQRSVVGSRERDILRAIQESASRPRLEIQIKSGAAASGAVSLNVRAENVEKMATGSGDIAEIWVAIAERNLKSDVKEGENAGRNLRHSLVLRSLKKLGTASASNKPAYEATAQVKLSREWKHQDLEMIVFAQEKRSRKVLGVASAELSGN